MFSGLGIVKTVLETGRLSAMQHEMKCSLCGGSVGKADYPNRGGTLQVSHQACAMEKSHPNCIQNNKELYMSACEKRAEQLK